MSPIAITVQSPGRINIIGEHTDYNQGFVLPAAIDKKVTFKIWKNNQDQTVNIRSIDLGERFSFDLSSFQKEAGGWQNYIMGVVLELQKIDAKIGGFNAEFGGDIPIGSGMSSSAALECCLAFGLNALFDLGLDRWQIIKLSQKAEHNFVGMKCGIMDQFASVMGKKGQVMLLDCQSLDFQYFPFETDDNQVLLLNTNVTHNLASSEYNTRRSECEQGVEIIRRKFDSVQSLRDVSLDMLEMVKSDLPEKVFRRCYHILMENDRVLTATKALLNKDFVELGQLLYESHRSLQNCYEKVLTIKMVRL